MRLCNNIKRNQEYRIPALTNKCIAFFVSSNESAVHEIIERVFMLSIRASSGRPVSRQVTVAFSFSQSTLRIRSNACGSGFRDCC